MANHKNFDKDSNFNVFRVVIGVSLVCSILVATSAVLLREKQVANQALDRKKNVLAAAGEFSTNMTEGDIEKAFGLIEPIAVDFEKDKLTSEIDPLAYDMAIAMKDPETSLPIPAEDDIANLRRIPKYGIIYLYKTDGKIQKIILPISGLGLWSTLYGFISLENDGITISGINFYDHAETPGLGGEVDNPSWQKNWVGKKVYQIKVDSQNSEENSKQYVPVIQVVKGSVDSSQAGSEHRVDGISGATITGKAVGDMVRFWLSEPIYGKFIRDIVEKENE